MKLVGVMVIAILAGCGSKTTSTPPAAPAAPAPAPVAKDPPKPTCDVAIGNAFEVSKSDPSMKVEPAMLAKVQAVMTKHCTDDAWPDATVSCFAGAKQPDQLEQCSQTIPKDKLELFMKDLMATMGAAPGPDADTGSADAPPP